MKKIFFIIVLFFILVISTIGLMNKTNRGTFDESMRARSVAILEFESLVSDPRIRIVNDSMISAKPVKNWMISTTFLFNGEFNDLKSLLQNKGWMSTQCIEKIENAFCKTNLLLKIQQETIEVNGLNQPSYYMKIKYYPSANF